MARLVQGYGMPSATVDTTLSQVYADVGDFIVSTLGIDSTQVVQGYANRVAMPLGGFVEMHITRSARLSTNVDGWDTTNSNPTSATQTQAVQLALQLSLYGPASGDWAAIMSTLLRDAVACDALAPVCQPLYSDDPIRAPLTDAEQQYEDKWVVTAQLQYNPTVSTAQQFANTLDVTLINVDEAYPP